MAPVQEKRLKGVYLVPDPAMLKPHFGPSEHIKVGLRELQRYFDIELLVLGEYPAEHTANNGTIFKGKALDNGLIGLVRDVKLLAKSNWSRANLRRELKKRRVHFIYERGQYLDYRGVMAAKELGVPHFYEVNWLNFLGIRQFYRSWFNAVARRLEEWSYRQSRLNFFVGTQHRLISIPPRKVCIIQNGVDESLMDENAALQNNPLKIVKICYVANLMPHHRFDIFVEALRAGNFSDEIELHLVGYHFEEFAKDIPASVPVKFYGPVSKHELPEILRQCNVGLISGGPSYSSFMKLFEYAAFKHCIICPDLENIRLMFNDDEIAMFRDGDANSLAERLKGIISDKRQIQLFGDNVFRKVKQKYTWTKIYQDIATQIAKKSVTA